MAHEFETGFFVTEPAWHGLGTVLQDPPSLEEAITCAGLDWSVECRPLTYINTETGARVTSASRSVVRCSDQTELGVVGPDYNPLQNAEAFNWFQPFIDAGHCRLEAAGSLRFGKRVWVLAKVLGSTQSILRNDPVSLYVLLANAHDGTMCAHVGFTGVRVVCQNTFTQALGDARSKLLRVKHTKNMKDALTGIQAAIDIARGDFQATAKQFQALAQAQVSETDLKKYVREVFAVKPDQIVSIEADAVVAEEQQDGAGSRIAGRILELFEAGRGTEVTGVRGTMWGAYNAVTEYITHERGRTQDARLDSAWFGQGSALSKRALSVGLRYAQAA